MKSLVVIFLTYLVVRSSAFCFPGESLTDCARRQPQEAKIKQQLITRSSQDDDENDKAIPCLGVSSQEGFIGECKKSSSCSEVSSESLNCLFSTVCCKKMVTVRTRRIGVPGDRPSDINENSSRQFEDLNQDKCGSRGNNLKLKLKTFSLQEQFFYSGPQNFVLGGEDVPEGALPFTVAFTHVSP